MGGDESTSLSLFVFFYKSFLGRRNASSVRLCNVVDVH